MRMKTNDDKKLFTQESTEMNTRTDTAGKLLMGLLIAGICCASSAEPVVLTGGWSADFSRAMMETAAKSTTVFQFEGSYKMTLQNKEDSYFSVSCVGMEAATRISDQETLTKGSGRCELADRQGEKLLARMDTVFDGFTLTIDGGTGKWSQARGTIVSKESFTCESEKLLRGYSNAKGDVQFKNP